MDQIYDVIIIGGGSAAASAVLTLKNRGKTMAVVTNKAETSSLYKAEMITNYPGLPPMTGGEMTALFRRQIEHVIDLDIFVACNLGNDPLMVMGLAHIVKACLRHFHNRDTEFFCHIDDPGHRRIRTGVL